MDADIGVEGLLAGAREHHHYAREAVERAVRLGHLPKTALDKTPAPPLQPAYTIPLNHRQKLFGHVFKKMSRLGWTEAELISWLKNDSGKLAMAARVRKETTQRETPAAV